MRATRMLAGVVAAPACLARWRLFTTVLLATALCAGCAGSDSADGDSLPPPRSGELSDASSIRPILVPSPSADGRSRSVAAGESTPRASTAPVGRTEAAAYSVQRSTGATSGTNGSHAASHPASAIGTVPTVEELLDEGWYQAGASPVHLAVRGTPAVDSVRCAWRGIAHTSEQRDAAIRFWLGIEPIDAIPNVSMLEVLFNAILDTVDPDYREAAKANFLAIARGGLSMDHLFLTCLTD